MSKMGVLGGELKEVTMQAREHMALQILRRNLSTPVMGLGTSKALEALPMALHIIMLP